MAKKKQETDGLQNLINQVNKEYGDGSLIRGRNNIVAVDIFPTNIAAIDIALGVGGIPQGRIIEIYGAESSGKTTACLEFIAACQKHYFEKKKRNGAVSFVDAEHALDPTWAKNIGVDMDKILLSQPNSGEEALNIVEMMAASRELDLIVVDSVAALTPKAEIMGEIGDHHVGAQARMMSQAMRKLKDKAFKSNTTVIFINQVREKIGIVFGCLHADTLVCFADGRSIPIREVVENEIKGEVWSFNLLSKKFEPKEIVGWHNNGDVNTPEDYLHITFKGSGTKNDRMQITVTPNHQVLCGNQWINAGQLSEKDKLTTKQNSSTAEVDIIDIRHASKRQMEQRGKYDISVADNHCYMAGGNPAGVIVHNSPEVTPGGRALKFYASIRAELSKGSAVKDGDVVVAFRPKMKFVKNKVAPPFTSAQFDICSGTKERPVYGIDAMGSLIDVAVGDSYKIITRSGSWYTYNGQHLGQGLGKASAFLHENPGIFEEIKQKTYDMAFGAMHAEPVQPESFDIDDEIIDAD